MIGNIRHHHNNLLKSIIIEGYVGSKIKRGRS